jgi:predicted phosphoribosyltransferase
MFNLKDAVDIANRLGIVFDKFSVKDFLTGLNIELEHGTVNNATNVTNDSLELTAKIALAHLNEFPDYYNNDYGLPAFERSLRN